MPFQKFGTADGKILKPEPDEREQMQRTASRIEQGRGGTGFVAGLTDERHVLAEEEDVE